MFSKSDRGNGASDTARSAPSLISANLHIVGNLKSDGEIQIDGVVDGDVSARLLTIGDRATLTGEVVADEVVVRGTVRGRICSRKVQLAKTAHVVGDIWHELLAIDLGAYVEGLCKRTDKPTEMIEHKLKALPVQAPKPRTMDVPTAAAKTVAT